MGSWSVHCGITNLTIVSGNDIVLLPIKKSETSRSYLPYLPATLPIFGTYDDYGGIEDIIEDSNTKLIEAHFGVTIAEFVRLFVDGHLTYDRDEASEVKDKMVASGTFKELDEWDFMFIDGEAYRFISTKKSNDTGHLEFGNPNILELIGFKEVGKSKDDRYNKKYKFGDVEVWSDGTWCHTPDGGSVYTWDDEYSSLSNLIDIPDDKQWIGQKTNMELWEHFDDHKAIEMLFGLMGAERSSSDPMDMVNFFKKMLANEGINDKERESYESLLKDYKKRAEYGTNTLLKSYMGDYKTYGAALSALNVFRSNLYCMSGYFKPNVLYITPQCGEHKEHQEILEGLAKINKARCYDED